MSTITALKAVLSCDTSGFTSTIGRATGKLTDLKAAGREVFEATRTPLEQYENEIGRLSGMLKRGQIDQQTYARAVQQTNDRLQAMRGASAAGRVFAQTRTPLENYRSQLSQANALLRSGQIDNATYGRHVRQLGATMRATSLQSSALGQALGGMGINLAALANPATAAAAGIVALTTAAAGAAAAGIKLAAEYEQTKVAFATMLGSAQTAGKVLSELSTFAAETPFEFPELANSAKKLAAFGVSADQLVPTLRVIGDVASGIGQPIGEIAEIYGKARTQGRLFGDDIRQLGGRGIPIIAELAKQFGVSESQVSKLVEQGKVGFDNLQRAFASLTAEGGRFEGMMDAQSQTLIGLWSTLKDNVDLALRDIGESIIKELDLKSAMRGVIEFTAIFRDEWVPEIAAAIAITRDFAIAVYEIDDALGGPTALVKDLLGAVWSLRDGLVDLELAFANLTGMDSLRDTIVFGRQQKARDAADRAAARQQKAPQREMRIETRDDTSAQEKAVTDLAAFSKSLDESIETIGLDSQRAKLKQFLDLAAGGKIKLDAKDLDEAKKKLDALNAAERNHAIAEFNAEIKQQIALLGQSADAAKLYEFATKGATEADLAASRALIAKRDAAQANQDAAKFVEDLKERIAAVGQSGDAAKFFELQKAGAAEASLATARLYESALKQKEALQGVADALKSVMLSAKMFAPELAAPFEALYQDLRELGQQLKAGKITQQQFDAARERGTHLAQSAVSIYESTRTPFEKFKADLAQLQELFSKGMIDRETFDRASRKGLKDLDKEGARNPSAISKGSAEAFSAILKATDRGTRESIAARQLSEQARTNAILARMEREQKERGPQIQVRDN